MGGMLLSVRWVAGFWMPLALVGLTGCLSLESSLEHQAQEVRAGAYDSAYTKAAQEAERNSADTVFWQAEAGTLALLAGRAPDAVRHLDEADNGFNNLARRRYGASALNTTEALAVNDCVMPYSAEGLDRVFINVYKALAYGAVGKASAMRVELNRARQRQFEWFNRCAEDVASQADSMRELSASERRAVKAAGASVAKASALAPEAVGAVSAEGNSAERAFGALRGFGNAYASHMAGITRWCAGDASRNDLAMAAALAPASSVAQADAREAERGVKPENCVWVYVEDGLAPKRVSRPFTLPLPSLAGHGRGMTTVSWDVPKLEMRSGASARYTANGVPLELLVDVDALAQDQFNRAWVGIVVRQVARTLLHTALQEGSQAAMRHGSAGDGAALLAGLAFFLYEAATNSADLRCADLLPKRVFMTKVARPKTGTLTLTPEGGAPISVRLPESGNALVWVRRPTATARATVLTVNLDARD